jgi:DNA-binding PadR family transcriptional regulator
MASEQLPEHAYVILGYVGTYAEGVHGYEIGRLLLRSPLGLPLLGLGQLYRVLHQLESARLVSGTVEMNGAARARYRFRMTRKGEGSFRQWLTGSSRGATPVRDQVLNRLRFADQVPRPVLTRLASEAIKECQAEIDDLSRTGRDRPCDADVTPLHRLALQARLVAYQRWLVEVSRLVEGSAPERGDRSVASGGKARA